MSDLCRIKKQNNNNNNKTTKSQDLEEKRVYFIHFQGIVLEGEKRKVGAGTLGRKGHAVETVKEL